MKKLCKECPLKSTYMGLFIKGDLFEALNMIIRGSKEMSGLFPKGKEAAFYKLGWEKATEQCQRIGNHF